MAEPPAALPAPPEIDPEAAPLQPVPRLGAIILSANCLTITLLNYLQFVPNACDTMLILEEFCKRDFADIFPYLLSLSATHWHRDVIKRHLRTRLFDLPLPTLKALHVYIPKLSALHFDDVTATMQPFFGPLSSMETARWDIHDWFYQLLHAKQMQGQLLFITISLSLLSRVTVRFL